MTEPIACTAAELTDRLLRLRAELDSGVWDANTGAYELFDPRCPSAGQCAVTALLIQDIFGGELLRSVNCGESHYFNRVHLADGTAVEVDLTRDQFSVWCPTETAERDRAYVESHPVTMGRYQRLLRRRNDAGLAPCGACAYCQGILPEEDPSAGTSCWDTLWVDPDRVPTAAV